tara:strand:- start:392 stop:559 length:168 start_codon:yes stop_codon:yes gene_type:complete
MDPARRFPGLLLAGLIPGVEFAPLIQWRECATQEGAKAKCGADGIDEASMAGNDR